MSQSRNRAPQKSTEQMKGRRMAFGALVPMVSFEIPDRVSGSCCLLPIELRKADQWSIIRAAEIANKQYPSEYVLKLKQDPIIL